MPVGINGSGTITGVPSGGLDAGAGPVLMTAQASTSGTSIDFTGIPSWVKRVTVMFNGVSTSGTANVVLHIGDSGGVETTGYVSGNANINPSTSVFTSTTGFLVDASVAATSVIYGIVILQNFSGNTWVESGTVNNAGAGKISNGSKTLDSALDRVRITTGNGTDTFDAGTINIMYE